MEPRRLLLIRHAKAGDAPKDVERPLTHKGARQAEAVGSWLAQAGLTPDRVVVSPARRAEQTWERAAAALGAPPQPVVDRRIYDNTIEALLEAIGETPKGVRTLAVVGHNPSVAELAAVLDDGRGNKAARREMEAGFRTGAVAVFALSTPFAAITPESVELRDFAVPGR